MTFRGKKMMQWSHVLGLMILACLANGDDYGPSSFSPSAQPISSDPVDMPDPAAPAPAPDAGAGNDSSLPAPYTYRSNHAAHDQNTSNHASADHNVSHVPESFPHGFGNISTMFRSNTGNSIPISHNQGARGSNHSQSKNKPANALFGWTGNHIDDCWRGDPSWARNRKRLADCGIGFGKDARGGADGDYYLVYDSSDNADNPTPGTLRYGATQDQPLWIYFSSDMHINLMDDLHISSYKTLDGRGAQIHISHGPCLKIVSVSHVIVHGLFIHDCSRGRGSDGDAISVWASHNVWIDHNYFAHCYDGLVDVTHACTGVTISNNVFTHHNKVMLLGHSDKFPADKALRVTVVYNHFGPDCVQRMPRGRFGYFHVANNFHEAWEMYAIGGSSSPTFLSEGNRYEAPINSDFKEVTKRVGYSTNPKWIWRSRGDMFLNGAYFTQSGNGEAHAYYSEQQNFTIAPASAVVYITAHAGPITCMPNRPC